MQANNRPEDLLPGTLDMLILKTLSRGQMHGYDVAESIQRCSEDVLWVEEGALYQSLHRLELRGLLSSEWGLSDNKRRAKFYRLTRAGRQQLASHTAAWVDFSAAVNRVLIKGV